MIVIEYISCQRCEAIVPV